jgi:hypothetical protein
MDFEFLKIPLDPAEDIEQEGDFTEVDNIIGKLATGEHVRIWVRHLPDEQDRDLIADLREAGAQVIVPIDN